MNRVVLTLLVMLCGISAAQDSISVSVERIAKTKFFAFGGVGLEKVTSEGEKDFKIVIAQPAAVALAAFEKLYATGNGEAKLYALAGIRRLDPKRFKAVLLSVKDSKEQVITMKGCILVRQTLGSIAKRIDSGAYDPWIEPRKKKEK